MTPSEIQALLKLRSEELKKTRMAANICQSDIARASGLHRNTIAKIERGELPWKVDAEIVYLETIKKIAKNV